MKIKLNLLSFLLPLYEAELGEGGGGVQAVSPSAEPSGDAVSPAVVNAGTSVESQPSVTGTEAQAEDDPLKDVPTVEELQAMAAQKVPHAEALARLRTAYEATKEQLKPYESWKPIIDTVGDPALVQTNQELFGKLYSPVENDANDYSTVPFLQDREQDSPGFVDKLYRDISGFRVNLNGVEDNLIRHTIRSWGLNPDNIEKYRQLENGTLPFATGVVSQDELAKIDPSFHDAFKTLSPTARQDILALTASTDENSRLLAQEHLRNAQGAFESTKFREQVQQKEQEGQKRQEQADQQTIISKGDEAINLATSEIYTAISSTLAQVSVSSNELTNEMHRAGIMSNLYTLLDKEGRALLLDPILKKAGIDLNAPIAGVQLPFDDVIQRFTEKTREAKKWEFYGQNGPASAARSEATRMRQFLTAKLNQIAHVFAEPTLNALVPNGNGNGATARQVPSGNGFQQKPGSNPYEANPHAFGSPEYYAFIKKVDRELSVNGAAVFS